MYKISIFSIIVSILELVACGKDKPKPVEWTGFERPAHFPNPVYDFSSNVVTEAGFALGKKLFYDGKLSRDGSISCGSCHIQYSAFTHHGHAVSHGIDEQLGSRNAPPIQNTAWQANFFWDGGVQHLDMLSIAPIENPVEMDETVANVLQKLRADSEYPALFEKAFGTTEINTARTMQALSQFMNMLVSANTRYDKFVQGDNSALNAQEQAGLAAFRIKCESCHREPLFIDNEFHYNGLFRTNDLGHFGITLNPLDSFTFKTPSLRNLDKTAPYMHDGRFTNLDMVLDHYQSGIYPHANLDSRLTNGFSISNQEKADIKAFLLTLTDEEFIRNPLFSE